MKKLLFILFSIVCTTINAQNYQYLGNFTSNGTPLYLETPGDNVSVETQEIMNHVQSITKPKYNEREFQELSEQYQSNQQDNEQSTSSLWQQLTTRPTQRKTSSKVQVKNLYEKHSELLDDFWQQCLTLGRTPANDEFEYSDNLRRVIGSHKKAFDLMANIMELEGFKQCLEIQK